MESDHLHKDRLIRICYLPKKPWILGYPRIACELKFADAQADLTHHKLYFLMMNLIVYMYWENGFIYMHICELLVQLHLNMWSQLSNFRLSKLSPHYILEESYFHFRDVRLGDLDIPRENVQTICKQWRPDQTLHSIWVCTVCQLYNYW